MQNTMYLPKSGNTMWQDLLLWWYDLHVIFAPLKALNVNANFVPF